jgi:hypothetical protein
MEISRGGIGIFNRQIIYKQAIFHSYVKLLEANVKKEKKQKW